MFVEPRFKNKVALITGGGGSIGRVTALRMAAEGASVAIFDANAASGAAAAAAIVEQGGAALAIAGSVAIEADVAAAMAACADAFGGLDVLVNNAAWAEKPTMDETGPDDWDREFAVTLRGAWLCARAALPLLEARRGAMVNIGSVNGMAYFGSPAYSAAKAGLLSLTRSIAVEYGPRGVRANMVSPGSIRTNHPSWVKRQERDPLVFEKLTRWYPVGRVGLPEDIAAAICFLASGDAAFVNGSNLVVDGGLTAGMPVMTADFL